MWSVFHNLLNTETHCLIILKTDCQNNIHLYCAVSATQLIPHTATLVSHRNIQIHKKHCKDGHTQQATHHLHSAHSGYSPTMPHEVTGSPSRKWNFTAFQQHDADIINKTTEFYCLPNEKVIYYFESLSPYRDICYPHR